MKLLCSIIIISILAFATLKETLAVANSSKEALSVTDDPKSRTPLKSKKEKMLCKCQPKKNMAVIKVSDATGPPLDSKPAESKENATDSSSTSNITNSHGNLENNNQVEATQLIKETIKPENTVKRSPKTSPKLHSEVKRPNEPATEEAEEQFESTVDEINQSRNNREFMMKKKTSKHPKPSPIRSKKAKCNKPESCPCEKIVEKNCACGKSTEEILLQDMVLRENPLKDVIFVDGGDSMMLDSSNIEVFEIPEANLGDSFLKPSALELCKGKDTSRLVDSSKPSCGSSEPALLEFQNQFEFQNKIVTKTAVAISYIKKTAIIATSFVKLIPEATNTQLSVMISTINSVSFSKILTKTAVTFPMETFLPATSYKQESSNDLFPYPPKASCGEDLKMFVAKLLAI